MSNLLPFFLMNLEFFKYEGAGNDFVLFDLRNTLFEPTRRFIESVCDRRFGIGADGVMLLSSDSEVEFCMRYFNCDGGEATMCGNGGRCIALFAEHLGIGGKIKKFRAIDGFHTAEILNNSMVRLEMCDVLEIKPFGNGFLLDTGSPHYVEFFDGIDAMDIVTLGRKIRNNKEWSSIGGANINFAQITGDGMIKLRTYERGVENETLACGTGATATAIVTNFVSQPDCNHFNVTVQGGELIVEFNKRENIYTDIYLTGPVRRVFSGKLLTENFI